MILRCTRNIPALWAGSLILLLLFPVAAEGQYREDAHAPASMLLQIRDAGTDVFRWYDVPVFAAYFVNRFEIVSAESKPVVLAPSAAEEGLARQIGLPGSTSIGSIEPFTIPHLLLGIRSLYTVGVGVLDEGADMRPALRHTMGLYKALVYTHVGTQLTKNLVYRDRPDKSDSKSFFSGHTSTAFAMSSYLQREVDVLLTDHPALLDRPTLRTGLRATAALLIYGWAGYVGYSRMRDNRHYLSDVIVGALIGTLIGNLTFEQVVGGDLPLHGALGLVFLADQPGLSLQMQF